MKTWNASLSASLVSKVATSRRVSKSVSSFHRRKKSAAICDSRKFLVFLDLLTGKTSRAQRAQQTKGANGCGDRRDLLLAQFRSRRHSPTLLLCRFFRLPKHTDRSSWKLLVATTYGALGQRTNLSLAACGAD